MIRATFPDSTREERESLLFAPRYDGEMQDLGTVFAFADVTMALLALCNLTALVLLLRVGMRIMNDYDRQIREGVAVPVLDVQRFADLEIDREAWSAAE